VTVDAIARLTRALDALEEPAYCSGRASTAAPVELAVGDDACAVTDKTFIAWLRARSEVAPFGDGAQTRIDESIRRTSRLCSRGETLVRGFDPSVILGEVEAALSPRRHLDATLIDVLLYPTGGLFERHKDTPRAERLLGTLIVGLPVAHTGGAFHVMDGRETRVIDWSGKPDARTLDWIALFGDVDHEIKRVESGARVTLVYALSLSDRPRADPAWDGRVAAARAAIEALVADRTVFPHGGELMIACSRHVIAPNQPGAQPRELDTLRGMDRDLADLFVACGLAVAVRTCIAATPVEEATTPRSLSSELTDIARLARDLPPKVVEQLGDAVVFCDASEVRSGEDDDEPSASSLASYLVDEQPDHEWIIRASAAATLIHEALFSSTGYFGNEYFDAYLYTLAALEVTIGNLEQRKLAAPPVPVARPRVRHAKFGDGEVVARSSNGKDTILEIAFDSGERKKLLERFVTPLDAV